MAVRDLRGHAGAATAHPQRAGLPDPGRAESARRSRPELRVRADQQAQYLAGTGRLSWLILLGPLAVLLGGDWDRPITAAIGAVLVVGTASAWALFWRRRVQAAVRWVADPPDRPGRCPLSARLRWLTGRRVVLVVGTTVAVGLIAGLAAAVLTRS
jgi:hypothetical protein